MEFFQGLWMSRLMGVVGLSTVAKSPIDAKLLFAQRFARLFAYGATYIILVNFFSQLGIADEQIGLFMTGTMLGDVVISFVLTLITDQVGRKKVLAAGALLMAVSGIIFSISSSYWMLLLASIFGVISPSGNEIGPFRAVEESVLAQLTEQEERSDIFVWYTMSGTSGAALGTVTSGWLVQLLQNTSWTQLQAYRVVFLLYAALGAVKLVLTLLLSRRVELDRSEGSIAYDSIEMEAEELLSDTASDSNSMDGMPTSQPEDKQLAPHAPEVLAKVRSLLPRISPKSLRILFRLVFLFALDSGASGMASPSWLTYFFTVVHHVSPSTLGSLFFTTNILATLSNLVALPLARRLGPLKTMTFTHLPSAIFLGLIPLPSANTVPGTFAAMVLLALRACTQSMDQAPRQAFLSAVVQPEERTAVLGVVNIIKTLAQAGGLGISGWLAGRKLWVVMMAGAGSMKAGYDLLILWTFLGMQNGNG